MGDDAFRCRPYIEGSPAAAAIVAGFGGSRREFEPAALALMASGYDAYVYSYDPAVLLEGDHTLLPDLIKNMKTDFESRTAGVPVYRHVGVSLGCGIAWNFQKDSRAEVEPGLYAAGGTNVARLIMRNHVFRAAIKDAYKQDIRRIYSGYKEKELQAEWEEIHKPPANGFVLALSDADPIIPAWQIRPNVRRWRAEGIPLRTKTLRHLGHTGTKKWMINNIPEMLALADSMRADNK